MKKILALMLAVLMVVGIFAGCNKTDVDDTKAPTNDTTVNDATNPSDENPTDGTEDSADATDGTEGTEGTEDVTTPNEGGEDVVLSEVAQLVTDITAVKAMQFPTMVMDVDLTDEFAVKSYTGLDSADDIEAAAFCEAAMGSQAYSVVLVKVKDAAKIEAVADGMKAGIDPRKWVCVEADDLKVAATGNYVILAMMDNEYAADCTAQDVIDAFADKCGEISYTAEK